LIYGNYHLFADPEPKDCRKLPVHIEFRKKVPRKRSCDRDERIKRLSDTIEEWKTTEEHDALSACLDKMKNTARITKIVCLYFGHIPSNATRTRKRRDIRYAAATATSEKLTTLYEQKSGTPLDQPISIITQNRKYLREDDAILSSLPTPIRLVKEPEGFLAIDQSTVVISLSPKPRAPVKQIVADLAAGSTGPAAMYWNDDIADSQIGGVDIVTYDPPTTKYIANPGSRRLKNMLKKRYVQVMDGNAESAGLYREDKIAGGYVAHYAKLGKKEPDKREVWIDEMKQTTMSQSFKEPTESEVDEVAEMIAGFNLLHGMHIFARKLE
jgi:hypothetical protein